MNKRIYIENFTIVEPGSSPDVSFVPPLARRRLSPLQKIFFALAKAAEISPSAFTVFATRDGEDTLTRRIVDDYHADGSVSPHRFSASVYNAAPGLWSVFAANRSAYTAIAAGEDTIECGILESLERPGPGLFAYAEETGGGYGAAFRLGAHSGREVEISNGDVSLSPLTFAALVDFLQGATNALDGRYIALRSV